MNIKTTITKEKMTAPAEHPNSQEHALLAVKDMRFAWPASSTTVEISELNVSTSDRWLLEGPSGSGKSTLLQLLGGVLLPQRGRVQLLGRSWSSLSASQRDRRRADCVGFLFQQFNLVPYLSALENVLLPCRFSEARRLEAERTGPLVDEARRLLNALGLGAPELNRRKAGRLSVGQQQRVAAARALIGRPALVLADEPTSALDADNRNAFLQLLFAEARNSGSALIVVSHDATLRPHFGRHLQLEAGVQ